MTLVDDRHGNYSNNDNDSVYDVVCLHATDDNKSYEPDILKSTESKEIESSQSIWVKLTESNFIAIGLNKLNELVALGIQEEETAVHKEDRSGSEDTSVQEFEPTVQEYRFFNFSKKEVKEIIN